MTGTPEDDIPARPPELPPTADEGSHPNPFDLAADEESAIGASPASVSPVPRFADDVVATAREDVSEAEEREKSSSKRRRPDKGTSRLGLLGFLIGVAAGVLCRPQILPASARYSPTPVAAVGLALGFLALLGILIGSRAKSGLPLMAILVCLGAISFAAYQDGVRDVDSTRVWANGQIQKYKTTVTQLKNKVLPPAPSKPVGGGPTTPLPPSALPTPAAPDVGQAGGGVKPNATGAPSAPGDPDGGVGAGTIFDMRPGSKGSTPRTTATPDSPAGGSPGNPTATPAIPGTDAGAPDTALLPGNTPVTPRILSARSALAAAQGKVKATEDNFRFAFDKTQDPQCLAAKAEVDAADKLVDEAKRRTDGYSQARIDATRQRKEAQEKVDRIVNSAMAQDAVVTASRRELAAAEEALRQASGKAARGR